MRSSEGGAVSRSIRVGQMMAMGAAVGLRLVDFPNFGGGSNGLEPFGG